MPVEDAPPGDAAEERLLAAIMRRMITADRMWMNLSADDLCVDGWVRLTPPEEALVRELTGQPDE